MTNTLIACWQNEFVLLEKLLATVSDADVIVFDDSGQSLAGLDLPHNARLIELTLNHFHQRDAVFRAPSDVALWLYKQPHYTSIYCSKQGGLGYFVACLKLALNVGDKWKIHWMGKVTTRDIYRQSQRFLDKEGVLRFFIETQQIVLSETQPVVKQHETVQSSADITIIIPFHNRLNYLPQTLLSLLQQTTGGFQVLIVNDASNEEARQQLGALINEPYYSNLNIRLIDTVDSLGAAGARNYALQQVKTPFVLFVDDDDVLRPDTLALCCEAQQRTSSDIITMAFCYFDGDDYPQPEVTSGTLIHFHSTQDWVSAMSHNFVGGITALYRTAILSKHGAFLCGRFAGEEDWQLLLKLTFAGCSCTYLPLPLLWYRNTPFSLSKKMLHFDSRQQLFELYKQVLPDQLAMLPEQLAAFNMARRISGREQNFAKLGWQLHPQRDKPLYIYGAGQIGRQVIEILCSLGLRDNIRAVIDRNAAFIRTLGEFDVEPLETCVFVPHAVVIIASLSFVDDIASRLPPLVETVIRMN
jgi:glycosyltransferase involved in cell wall biosynthesis